MSNKPEEKKFEDLGRPEVKGDMVIEDNPTEVYFDYTVNNFFKQCEKPGECFYSPPVSFLNARWRLRIYPFGEDEPSYEGGIGLYVYKEDSDTPKHITYNVGIRKKDRTLKAFYGERVFDREKGGRGMGIFLHRVTVENDRNNIAPGGTVSFFCKLNHVPEKEKFEATKRN